jgi:probable rRNA maturation factor
MAVSREPRAVGRTRVEVHGAHSEQEARALRRFLREVAAAEKCTARELSLVLVTNPEIRRLNRRFLGRNRFTDVISFPISSEFLGEIYVSRDRARLQAREYDVPVEEELYRLVLHGLLHLLGYSHHQMPPLERRYLASSVVRSVNCEG